MLAVVMHKLLIESSDKPADLTYSITACVCNLHSCCFTDMCLARYEPTGILWLQNAAAAVAAAASKAAT